MPTWSTTGSFPARLPDPPPKQNNNQEEEEEEEETNQDHFSAQNHTHHHHHYYHLHHLLIPVWIFGVFFLFCKPCIERPEEAENSKLTLLCVVSSEAKPHGSHQRRPLQHNFSFCIVLLPFLCDGCLTLLHPSVPPPTPPPPSPPLLPAPSGKSWK